MKRKLRDYVFKVSSPPAVFILASPQQEMTLPNGGRPLSGLTKFGTRTCCPESGAERHSLTKLLGGVSSPLDHPFSRKGTLNRQVNLGDKIG